MPDSTPRPHALTTRRLHGGTAEGLADFIEALGEVGNDGFVLSGELHPVTVLRMLDRLVPIVRRRGILRRELGGRSLRSHLRDL